MNRYKQVSLIDVLCLFIHQIVRIASIPLSKSPVFQDWLNIYIRNQPKDLNTTERCSQHTTFLILAQHEQRFASSHC